ncbi:crotonase/enoyl-CoA hydratase family protein [Nocardioides sp. JQ2195]|nr:crotonase/enoyl-CoA hydratase family protein [Nocardioides sp. JQ2195]
MNGETPVSEVLTVEASGHIETWTINLPDMRNPISGPDVVEAFVDNASRVDRDPNVRCVIITGAGSAFSAGGNVREMADGNGMFGGSPYEQRNGYRHGIQQIPLALHNCEVPLIAAVNGPAVGAGCDLAMMCDLRIMSERAFFAESFVQLGLIPGDGGAWFLTHAVGPARAAEMALTGDRVDSATALEWGLVSRVSTPEALLDDANALAERVAKNPPHGLRMAKKLLRESRRRDLADVLELSASMQALAHHTPEHRAAVEAFVKK